MAAQRGLHLVQTSTRMPNVRSFV